MNGERRNACRILVGMPGGLRPLGRKRQSSVDNIKTDHGEIGWDSMDWIYVAQDGDQWMTCECGNESSGSIKYCEVLE
jgi:hypothetical protein